MQKTILIAILIMLFLSSVLTAAPKQKEKILVVLLDKPSWFKQSIIDSLKTTYLVDVVNATKPGDIKSADYKSVIVMDQLKAWMMGNGKLKKFSKFMDPKHTVYFVTSGDKNWKWKKEGIRTVTSASKSAKVSEVMKELRLKIEEN